MQCWCMMVQDAPTPLDNSDPLLTPQEVCKILRVNHKTLYRRRPDKTLPGIPINEKRFLYRRSAVKHFPAMAEAGTFKKPTKPPIRKNRGKFRPAAGKRNHKARVGQ
jgi:hypothetical protein